MNLTALLGRLAVILDGLVPRAARWLAANEPLWLVTGAGAVLDAVVHLVPVVPDSWHPYINIAVVVLGVISGRALVTPVTASGGIPAGPLTAAPPATGPAGTSTVRRVGTVLDSPAPTTPPAGMPGAQVVDAPKPGPSTGTP